MNRYYILISFCFIALFLSACEGTKEQFDFSQKAPDEFAVVKRAPLEMPPNYTLRPPQPGAVRPQEQNTTQQAEQTVFGEAESEAVQTEKPLTTGESILLRKTRALNVDPNIRTKIDQETATRAEEEKPTIDRILGVTGKKYEAPAKTVDPVKERERIIQTTKEK